MRSDTEEQVEQEKGVIEGLGSGAKERQAAYRARLSELIGLLFRLFQLRSYRERNAYYPSKPDRFLEKFSAMVRALIHEEELLLKATGRKDPASLDFGGPSDSARPRAGLSTVHTRRHNVTNKKGGSVTSRKKKRSR